MLNLYPENATERLEFDKVRQLLLKKCRTENAKSRVDSMRFLSKMELIHKALQQTHEYKTTLDSSEYFPNDFILDISKELKLVLVKGASLKIEDLASFRSLAVNFKNTISWFKGKKELFPQLFSLVENVEYEKEINHIISEVIDDNGKMRNDASHQLLQIRTNLDELRLQLRRTFDGALRKFNKLGYLADIGEGFLNGRRTLAVLAEYKRIVKGILHGNSDSQKTAFIEPESTIDLNNDVLSLEQAERKEIHQLLLNGELNILVGTHALLEDVVQFQNLGLVIIDEQHRFGVEQRAKLWRKNLIPPHMLVMTATPIPRTLAMTLYGDLDISVIDELPAGRKPIQTMHLYESSRLRMFGLMREEIQKGRQVYVVYPLIKESETLDLLYLEAGIEALTREFPRPKYQLSIVHGKLSAKEKEFEMQRFVKGETQIMVATTVIEVGVNVPNASVMVIENSERFGLSQLHQLRGRVGRGAEQSFCILMSTNKLSREGRIRLETMVRTTDGFEIAETDLQLRGPGDIGGTQQSGVLDLKLADLSQDQQLLQSIRTEVIDIFEKDPELIEEENVLLKSFLNKKTVGIAWEKIS